nr:hypothetical protein [Saccharolobus solfataricus]
MPLDPRIKKLLESALTIPIGKAPVEEVRKIFRQLASAAPKVEVGKVEDIKYQAVKPL